MSTPQDTSSRPVPISQSPDTRGRSPSGSLPRTALTARLASPVASGHLSGTPRIRQIPTPAHGDGGAYGSVTPLAGATNTSSLPGPGISALAAALSNSIGTSPPRFGTPPLRPLSPAAAGAQAQGTGLHSNYGSFDNRPRSVQGSHGLGGPVAYEDPEIVKRHLVQPSEASQVYDGSQEGPFAGSSMSPRGASPAMHQKQALDAVAPGLDEEEFSSLRLQGGDITRPIYRWAEEAEARAHGRGRNQRSKSFHISRPEPGDETLDIGSIKQPGGMRRNYIRRAAHSPSPGRSDGEDLAGMSRRGGHRPRMLTSNFIEFLTLYGHFAGEELEEDDEVLAPDEYFSSDVHEDDLGYGYEGGSEDEREPMEDSALLTPGRRKRKRKDRGGSGQNTSWGATLLLLKSFVGTGVLFLPKAYLNGGMVFSNLVLLFVACLSYYCFVLLVNTRMKVDGSFGDIGGILYGKWMRTAILGSIVLSQIGFVAAYIVFTSENLQAFILAVSDCRTYIDIKWMILMQMAVFLPFSLLRDISKLAITALIADGLILVGLLYLYYYDILTIVRNHGVADIVNFNNNNWQLFIGTAIFTFEGIGLIIPIQESMRRPKDFPWVLGGVMIVITVVFISMGALSYAAYGSKTETVVILNLPQDDKFVNAVQFMYSLAILLSTPLQIFPAIRITETELFTRSGKYNPWIKWQKNIFRFFVVMLCAAIAWGGANDLDKFVSLVGCFACVPLVYIYPVSPNTFSYFYASVLTALAHAPLQGNLQDSVSQAGRHSPCCLRSCRHGVYNFSDNHELGKQI
jgi:proton-coupled amino acid transporter